MDLLRLGGWQQPDPRGGLGLAGTRILHSIGAWPAVIDDETVVESSGPGEDLVLLAKIRPAAKARITLQLIDFPDGGCRVAMSEVW